jgi:nitroreductase
MDVMTAIRTRRTHHEFRPDPVPREVVEACLDAATWAPNHKLTEPWEFYVFTGDMKERLARLRGELKLQKHADPESEQARRSYGRAYGEMATAPWAILVAMPVADDPHRRQEDYAACACAILNLMLAAHAQGVAAYWGTGPLIHHPETHRLLGVPEGRQGVGLVLLGRPAAEPPVPPRTPASGKTRWFY